MNAADREKRERAYRANNLGVALLEQLKYPEAATAFRDALAIDPALGLAHLNLSLALLYAQDFAGAQHEAELAAQQLPEASQPQYVLGLIARSQSRNDVARAQFDRVRQSEPTDVGVNINVAQIALEDQRYADAIGVLRPVVEAEPSNVTAAYVYGLALTRNGATEEGQRWLEKAQELRRSGYAVTFGTGYLEQGHLAEALASTGREPDLLAPLSSRVVFTAATLAPRRATDAASAPSVDPAGARGSLTTFDVDGDGDLDALLVEAGGLRLLQNDGTPSTGPAWTDVTAASGLGGARAGTPAVTAVAADFDNDGASDLFVFRATASGLYRNDGKGHFSDVTARAGFPPFAATPTAVAWVDVDHDGDVDLVLAGSAGRPQLLRNNRDGSFTDVSAAARLDHAGDVVAIVPSDYDNHRDVDLLFAYRDAPPVLYANQRDGGFRDVTASTGLTSAVPAGGVVAAGTGDINKDDAPDFIFATTRGVVAALSDGRGRFSTQPIAEIAGLVAVQVLDYDDDGLLDVVAWSSDGPHAWRNEGRSWRDVTNTAIATAAAGAGVTASARGPIAARAVAAGDFDGDGHTDLAALAADTAWLWRNSGDPGRHSLRIALRGLVSNKASVGAKLQIRAASLSSRLELSAASPAVAPADVVFGLGERPAADVIRVLWPSGILQAEVVDSGGSSAPLVRPAPVVIEELDRKPSSCPFLFTWNGERFEFVTDFLGGGEMGDWVAPGRFNSPDPLEYVRIRGDQLKARDGVISLRVTNELEETLFLDQVQLVAIAHPADVAIFPNEGMTDPPKPHRLHPVAHVRPVARASDEHGHDVTARVAARDWQAPDDFTLAAIRGYAEPHTLTIDVGHVSRPVLLLTAWTDYAFSSDNVAAQQAGLTSELPSLSVQDAAGRWRPLDVTIGLPVGRPQTIAIDLTGQLRPGERVVRLATNMRIYWDQVAVGEATAAQPLTATLDASTAVLRERGFSAELRSGRQRPTLYDYDQVTLTSPWKAMAGHFTRPGDVRTLLAATDDQFVIARPGDEVALQFPATALAPLPDGWTRTYLLRADGFSKEMDPNSGSPYTVEPLPFHRMTRYPYDSTRERYPETAASRAWRDAFNTRLSVRPLPPLAPLASPAAPSTAPTGGH